MMKFSLLLGTLNRPLELNQCFKTILNQKYPNYEVIIVDQSDNDETEKLIYSLRDPRFIYIRTIHKGLSHARNLALKKMTGDYFCLIDDDALYDDDYLQNGYEIFGNNHTKTILSGYIWNLITEDEYCQYSKLKNNKILNTREVMRYCPSAALFFPYSCINEVGFFDERLGVGSKYCSGEETDYLLRCLKKGYRVIYSNKLYLKHPYFFEKYRSEDKNLTFRKQKKAERAVGQGALFGKQIELLNNYSIYPIYLEIKMKMNIKFILNFYKDYSYNHEEIINFKKGFKEMSNMKLK